MSDNAVAIGVVLPVIVMVGILLIVVAWKVLDIARERARHEPGDQHPALVELRQVVGADLAEVRRRLDALEAGTDAAHREDRR